MMFNRTKPCKTCPFRKNNNGLRFLGTERAEEIAESLINDQSFDCHDDLGKPDPQHCAGAMLILEKIGRPNQMMRIGERLGGYDHRKLKGANDVFDSFEEWIEVQEC